MLSSGKCQADDSYRIIQVDKEGRVITAPRHGSHVGKRQGIDKAWLAELSLCELAFEYRNSDHYPLLDAITAEFDRREQA